MSNVQIADLAGGAQNCTIGILAAIMGALANYNIYRCRDGKYLAVGSLEPKFFTAFLKEITPAFLWPKPKKKKAKKPATAKAKGGSETDKLYELAKNPKKMRRVMLPVKWLLQLILLTKTRDQWDAKLAHLDTCVSGILTLEEALQNEQIQARGFVEQGEKGPLINSPLRFVGAQTHTGESPKLGEHNQLHSL